MAADTPELRPPKSMYENAVAAGATKASSPPLKTFILGILSGCHIAFGGFMLLAVGGKV
jgi:formate/nitrite transporter FocA (FNT family)